MRGQPKKHLNGVERFSLYLNPEEGQRVRNYSVIWRKNLNDTIRQCINYTLADSTKDKTARKEIINMKLSEIQANEAALNSELAQIEQEEAQEIQIIHDNEEKIAKAHERLLDALTNSHNRIEKVSENPYRFYSEYCGIPVAELKAWLKAEADKRMITGDEKCAPKFMDIEKVHQRLLEVLKSHHNQMNSIPDSIWLFYGDLSKQTVEELKAWMNEKIMKEGIRA